MDGERNALNDRGLTLEQARMTVHDRAYCRSGLVNFAFGCVGTCRAQTIGDDLHFVVMYSVI